MSKKEQAIVGNKTRDLPKDPGTPVSNVRNYFTPEVNQQIGEMSMKQMESILRDLPNSQYWIAILKYTQARMPMLDAQLRMTDPYREPYKMTFAQGCMAGLCDLETFVIDLNTPEPAQANENPGGTTFGTGA